MTTYLTLGYSAIAGLWESIRPRRDAITSRKPSPSLPAYDNIYDGLPDIDPDSGSDAMLFLERGATELSMEILSGDHEVFPLEPCEAMQPA